MFENEYHDQRKTSHALSSGEKKEVNIVI